jgi:beta-N-acetylhexosaminidase
MGITSAIFGCSGLSLTQQEKDFYQEVQPWGFILFGRNVDTPEQVTSLVAELKACVNHDDVPILIDQEGGRVRRLRPPHWEAYPAGEVFGQHYSHNKEQGLRFAWLQSRLMACDLHKLGVNVDCLPVLDVPVRGSHDVIGDRAYGDEPVIVSDVGLAASEGLLSGGVLPVIKHIPGHGRAGVDSHKDLPVVNASLEDLKQSDFEPFKRLNHMPLAMTAHVVYTAIDADNPATTSSKVIKDIIRDYIGFDGLLMCDDLSMHALKGTFEERTSASFAAGCDVVLHCNGDLSEMRPIASVCPELSGDSLRRAVQATDLFANVVPCNEESLRNEFRALCNGETYGQDPTEAGH